MLQFFVEGGVAMWVILAVGAVFLFSAARFAARPEKAHYGLLLALGAAVLALSLVGVFMDLAQVLWVVNERFATSPERGAVLLQGLKECTRPGTFGGGVLAVGSMLVAVGAARLARRPAAA